METMMRRLQGLRDRGADCRRDRAVRLTARLLAGLIVLAGIFDVISTEAMLAAGAIEANPLMAAVQQAWGIWWFFPKLLVHIGVAGFVLWLPSRRMIRTARLGVLLYAVIIASNFNLAGWTL